MAKNGFEQLLEFVVNGEQAKAEELFHQLVVAKSREIYENLLEEEMPEDDIEEGMEDDDDVEESADNDDDDIEESAEEDENADLDEMFSFEEEEEEEEEGKDDSEDDGVGGDETDDMMHDIGAEGDSDDDGMDSDEPASKSDIMDLKTAFDDLRADFAQMLDAERHEEEENPDIHGGMLPKDDMESMDDMDSEEDEMMMPFEEEIESIDRSPAAMMREYVDKMGEAYKGGKVAGTTEGQPVGATNSSPSTTNKNSLKFNKNDMGGTVKNIAQNAKGDEVLANQGVLKGNGLLGGKPKDMNTGNVNKVGGTNVKQFYKNNSKGHGAEKKGSGEVGGTDKKSLFK